MSDVQVCVWLCAMKCWYFVESSSSDREVLGLLSLGLQLLRSFGLEFELALGGVSCSCCRCVTFTLLSLAD